MNNDVAIRHIAIIMDGNGRWARANGKSERKRGHIAGAENVFAITKCCIDLQIPYLTLYAFSTENWHRPKLEVDFLMKLLNKYLTSKRDMYMQHEVRFNVIGDISELNPRLRKKISTLKEDTSHFNKITQTLSINYGSRDEIARACCKIFAHKESLHNDMRKDSILQLIESNLDTYHMPDVDILIRTGGEQRLSNFLLWQSSYAELFFTDTLWPDFRESELIEIVNAFKKRIRKFGNIELDRES